MCAVQPVQSFGQYWRKRKKEENSDVCYRLQFLKKCLLEQQREGTAEVRVLFCQQLAQPRGVFHFAGRCFLLTSSLGENPLKEPALMSQVILEHLSGEKIK